MNSHIPFPSINQFRHVVSQVKRKASFVGLNEAGEPIYNPAAKFPTLAFVGTVKLHGTNAAVVFTPDAITFQSRERVLTAEQDNAGFYAYMSMYGPELEVLCQIIMRAAGKEMECQSQPTIAIYGEWCGGNVQKGVAINGLPKMFVVFAVKIDGEWFNEALPTWTPSAVNNMAVYSIYQFPKWFINIDFENPEAKQNLLGELTQAVEDQCPVGKHFGNNGIGEGIVWRCIEDPSPDLWFKVKGEKHSVSKVKTLAAVDTEAVETLQAFVAQTVTEARLQQGLHNVIREQRKPFDMTSLGEFIRWVHGDVMKEEADTLEASGIEPKKIGGPIAQVAKRWYVEQMNQVPMAA
jgi:hypothetical protein